MMYQKKKRRCDFNFSKSEYTPITREDFLRKKHSCGSEI